MHGTVRSIERHLHTVPDCHPRFLEPGTRFAFQLTGEQGAVLITKYPTYRKDIRLGPAFEEYTKRHYDSWVTFARDTRRGNNIKPVLVTGIDTTRDFAMMVYSNNSTRLSSEFTASVPLVGSASAPAWGTWINQSLVHTNCGPQLSSSPSLETLDSFPHDSNQACAVPEGYDQCVFIRYYAMRQRGVVFPKIGEAGAGSRDHDPGNNRDETLPELMHPETDSDTGSNRGGTPTTDGSSSVAVTGCEPKPELFHNVSSVCQSLSLPPSCC